MSEKTEKALKEVFKEYLLNEAPELLTEMPKPKDATKMRKVWDWIRRVFGSQTHAKAGIPKGSRRILPPWARTRKWRLILGAAEAIQQYQRHWNTYNYEDWKKFDPIAYGEWIMLEILVYFEMEGGIAKYAASHLDENGEPFSPFTRNPERVSWGIQDIAETAKEIKDCKMNIGHSVGKQGDVQRCEKLFLELVAKKRKHERAVKQAWDDAVSGGTGPIYNEDNPAYKILDPSDPDYKEAEELIRRDHECAASANKNPGCPLTKKEVQLMCTYIYGSDADECG